MKRLAVLTVSPLAEGSPELCVVAWRMGALRPRLHHHCRRDKAEECGGDAAALVDAYDAQRLVQPSARCSDGTESRQESLFDGARMARSQR